MNPLCIALALAAGQETASQPDERLQPLAASLATYSEAREGELAVEAAEAVVVKELARMRGELGGTDPLRLPGDLGRALWLSRRYSDQAVRAGNVVTDTVAHPSFGAAGMEYAYRVPRGYDPRAAYPLILAIPHSDETPAEHLRQQWTLPAILDGAVLVCPQMPADPAAWTQVMAAGRPGGLSHVLTALRAASERFAVDPERVFVVGRGLGVPVAIVTGNYAPQRFAGIVGRAGDAGEQGPENFSNLPTYFAGGGAGALAFQQAARAAGGAECTLQAEGKEQDVWTWMQQHPRRRHPDSVTLVPGKPFPTRAYWLAVAPSAPDARADATVERGTNTIRITAHGASHVILYLNDALVDLELPLKVVCNGAERSLRVQRRLATTLDLLHGGISDPGCVYVAEAILDLSAADVAHAEVKERDAELEGRYAAAGDDPGLLWELEQWCRTTERAAGAERVLRKLLRVAPDHEPARELAGHASFEGSWFTSRAAYERFLRGQEEATAKERGYVKHRSVWMPAAERSRHGKGQVKDFGTGQWLTNEDRQRLAEGWVRQDLEWIPPQEAAFVDDGLWKVQGEWCDLATANRRHARIDAMWHIPGPEVLLHSTADRATSLAAMEHMGRALLDLRKVFGAEPLLPLEVALLRDEEQYDRFAFGDPDGRRRATHAGRLHVIHSAFFAESWFERVEGKLAFRGMGVCYWDPLAPHGDLYGVHAARLAAGLSYVDALDPSPKAVRQALAAKGSGPGPEHFAAYQAEKQLPAWLRWGGAVYAERYFHDPTVVVPDPLPDPPPDPMPDPWWARTWSLDNLKSRGGLRPLREVLELRLDPDQREDGQKLLLEAGLVVAFLVDGGAPAVEAAHAELKRALLSGRLHASDVRALAETLVAHEAELRAFAGL
jgi:hypothetical protein